MALRIYEYNGGTYQFTEGREPDGAVLVVEKVAPEPVKAKRGPKPANKMVSPDSDK